MWLATAANNIPDTSSTEILTEDWSTDVDSYSKTVRSKKLTKKKHLTGIIAQMRVNIQIPVLAFD